MADYLDAEAEESEVYIETFNKQTIKLGYSE